MSNAYSGFRSQTTQAPRPRKAYRRSSPGLGTHSPAARSACPWLSADGDQSRFGPRASLLHQIPDRQRHHQAQLLNCSSRWCSAFWRYRDSGNHVVFVDAIALEGRAAPDHGTSSKGSSAYRLVASLVSRFDQERRAGLAHHERCRRRSQPDRHRIGRFGRRPDDRGNRAGRAVSHQRPHDRRGFRIPAAICPCSLQSLWDHPSHLSRARQDQC